MAPNRQEKQLTDLILPHYRADRCIHCNLCIKACKTDAIETVEHTKQIIQDRCVACGHCIGACPTGALSAPSNKANLTNDLETKERPVAAILSPECALSFSIDSLPHKLRTIGFDYVFDLKTARELHALIYAKLIEQSWGTTLFSPTCPALQYYIKAFHKNYTKQIIPLKRPHILLATFIRQTIGNVRIYYITPCIAEQLSTTNVAHQTLPITIAELSDIIENRYRNVRAKHDYAIDRLELKPTLEKTLPLDNYQTYLHARGVPLTQESHLPNITQTKERFKDRRFLNNKRLLEAYFCDNGCNSGPGLTQEIPHKKARHTLHSYETLLEKVYPETKQKKKKSKQTDTHRFSDLLGQTIQNIFRARGIFEPHRPLSELLDGYTCRIRLQGKKKATTCSLAFPAFE